MSKTTCRTLLRPSIWLSAFFHQCDSLSLSHSYHLSFSFSTEIRMNEWRKCQSKNKKKRCFFCAFETNKKIIQYNTYRICSKYEKKNYVNIAIELQWCLYFEPNFLLFTLHFYPCVPSGWFSEVQYEFQQTIFSVFVCQMSPKRFCCLLTERA